MALGGVTLAATQACDVGDLVRLSAAFDNGATPPVATDPTAVTLQIKDPTGALVTPAPTPIKDSTGHYHHDLSVTLAGVWRYRFAGTGAVVAAEEAKVFARDSAF